MCYTGYIKKLSLLPLKCAETNKKKESLKIFTGFRLNISKLGHIFSIAYELVVYKLYHL